MARWAAALRSVEVAFQQATEEAKREFVLFAETKKAEVVAKRGAASREFVRYVNGDAGAPDSAVTIPGEIAYSFDVWGDVVSQALDMCVKSSPQRTGRYVHSWFVLVNGVVAADLVNIPRSAVVTISNDQPYHRKIEVGHSKFNGPGTATLMDSRVIERVRGKVLAKYRGVIEAEVAFIHLTGPVSGYAKQVPYELKGKFKKGWRIKARKKLRSDTKAGLLMTYPALQMRLAQTIGE